MGSKLLRLANRGEELAGRLARHLVRWYLVWVLGFLALTAGSIYFVAKLELKSDFVELLPENFQSVKDLHRLVDRVGGLGNLYIALMSEDLQASERLADDLAGVLDRDFSDRILYYEYKVDAVRKYYAARWRSGRRCSTSVLSSVIASPTR